MEDAMQDEPPADPAWRAAARSLYASFTIALRRLMWSKFMIANMIFCAIPLGIATVIALVGVSVGGRALSMAEVHEIQQQWLRTLYLHFIVFFLANIFGFAVVRQEIEGQTLHYLLLQPARRWALFFGRYLSYILIVSLFCVGSLWLSYLIMMIPLFGLGATVKDLAVSGQFVLLLKESGVLALGLAAYGAIAMLAGSFFKTALYAVLLLAWEWVLPYVPQALKEWTLLYYLQSLLPQKPHEMQSMFELLGDLASPMRAIVIILLITLTALAGAMAVFQQKECQYAEN